jgi:hypothetical protein
MKPAGWVLALIIQGMIEDGDAVPEPSKIDAMAEGAAKQHAIAFMVSVEAPDATVCVNLSGKARLKKSINWPKRPTWRGQRTWCVRPSAKRSNAAQSRSARAR